MLFIELNRKRSIQVYITGCLAAFCFRRPQPKLGANLMYLPNLNSAPTIRHTVRIFVPVFL